MSIEQPAPRVSICVPARNAAPFVGETLDSIRAQTFEDWELIIVENGSTDGTHEVLAEWMGAARDPRVIYRRNERTLGMADNWNRAVGLARAELVKVICADDTLLPRCLEAQVAAMGRHSEAALAACARTIVGPAGQPLFKRCGFPKTGLYGGGRAAARTLGHGANLIGDPVAVLFRRSLAPEGALFRPETVYYSDLDLWVRMLARGPMWFDTEALCRYRLHGNATTDSVRKEMLPDFFRVVDCAAGLGLYSGGRFARAGLALRVRAMNVLRGLVFRYAVRLRKPG
jgi:glycosyltransferase involved in cell wall biosynthesis